MKKKNRILICSLALLGICLIATVSCKKKTQPDPLPVLTVSQSYQGGVIAYILQAGDPGYDATVQHGLIAASSDQGNNIEWGCFGTTILGADGLALGTGNQNTMDILNGCGTAGTAARLCSDLVLGGYDDWYLPGKEELEKLYSNRAAIGGFANSDFYWSSSESDANGAWGKVFFNGFTGVNGKNYLGKVRAIRSF